MLVILLYSDGFIFDWMSSFDLEFRTRTLNSREQSSNKKRSEIHFLLKKKYERIFSYKMRVLSNEWNKSVIIAFNLNLAGFVKLYENYYHSHCTY